ncbi:MAG: UDP-N-acetylglucosamine--N-acetylmuramyl-(pentapeptide) pyrophosphoryl-undecaprenol N-acetylglucosamine transferase [Chlamydiota bacterium]
MSKKVLIAAAGTGGHLFPAQALAQELQALGLEVRFAGHGLSSNRYFNKEEFTYDDVSSATPYNKNVLKAAFEISKGLKKSLKIVRSFKPDIVVGFGSFHSFPVLLATLFFKVPVVVFEANSIPGKVNRFFSRFAYLSAVHFPEAGLKLFGKMREVAMPLWKGVRSTQERARDYFSLDVKKDTLLVFGGSQGALSINTLLFETAPHFAGEFQVIHFTGDKNSLEEMKRRYEELNISACVKEFEPRMDLAWQAATMAVCRSGAATLAELIEYEVPAILLPYPHAADDHQRKNAECMEKTGGAFCFRDTESFLDIFIRCKKENSIMQQAIRAFKQGENKSSLSSLINEVLCMKSTSIS